MRCYDAMLTNTIYHIIVYQLIQICVLVNCNRSQFVSLGNMRTQEKKYCLWCTSGTQLMFQTKLSICYLLMILTSYIRAKNLKPAENIVNKELHLIYAWLYTNKLSINLSKINFMFFSKSKRPRIPRIYINNHQINQLKSNAIVFNSQ